jgi:pseudaminic acid biosynthesis-associated methylase
MGMTDSTFKTEQEAFWAGQFGSDYAARNQGAGLLAANLKFFARALDQAHGMQSCIEFGANIGMNLRALQLLYPGLKCEGIEINPDAAAKLGEIIGPESVHHRSILEFEPTGTRDLVLIKGVLIHINPDALGAVYDKLAATARRYLLVAEYYNPSPVAVTYRGHQDRLFKRDFAGEIMERNPAFRLSDYGFAYRRDPDFPQDDITWFLLEKG